MLSAFSLKWIYKRVKRNPQLTLEQYPQSAANVTTSGTITGTTEKISVRGRGRAVKIRYTTNTVDDTPWRLGSQKLELRPDGRR